MERSDRANLYLSHMSSDATGGASWRYTSSRSSLMSSLDGSLAASGENDEELPYLEALARSRGFALGDEVARGGASRVFVARRCPEGQREARADGGEVVCFKFMPRASVRDFNREAQLHRGAAGHGGVVDLVTGWEDPVPCLVTEYCLGGSLYELLARPGVPGPHLHGVVGQVGEALAFLHGHGVAHRDVTSPNVLFVEEFRPDRALVARLCDFGHASLVDGHPGEGALRTRARGNLAWLAPERLGEGAPVLVGSDVYSLGVILWETLSRQRPFKYSIEDTMARKRQGLLPGSSPIASGPCLDAAYRCLSVDVAGRPSAADIARLASRKGAGNEQP